MSSVEVPAPAQLVRLHPEDEDGHVVSLVLDRPAAGNAISAAMARQVADLTASLAVRPGLRAVVVRSSSPTVFCLGADLKERRSATTADLLAVREVNRACYRGVLDLPVPTVAAVTGHALGGGCELALSCDLLVGDPGTRVGLPEVGVGLIPGGGGTQLAQRRLGWGRAADLVLTGRHVPGEEAYRMGLLDRLVGPGEVVVAALELARLLASRSPTAARAAKAAMREGSSLALGPALEVEDAAWRQVVSGADRVEGISAFVDKREPRWSAVGTDPG